MRIKTLVVGLVIGLGLVVGFGFGNDINANEVSETYMTYEEYYEFEEMIHDLYLEEYCVNYCNECDSYYYDECFCMYECEYDDCEHDYAIFIEDHYEMIMDIYEEVLRGIQQEENEPVVRETNEMIICEF